MSFIKSVLLTLILSLGYFENHAQSFELKGLVLDQDNGEPVSFAHVYSPGVFGTICNEAGRFITSIDSSHIVDSIYVSALGYQNEKYSIDSLITNKEIKLEIKKKTYLLEEIQITPSIEIKSLGPEYVKKHCNLSFRSAIPFQIGILLEVPFKAKILAAEYYIMKSKYSKTAFRARVYAYDTLKNKPGKELTKRTLLGQNEKKKGWTKVDLERENIYVSNEKIFVAFELVYVGDEYYYTDKFINEESILYGARVRNCIYGKDQEQYKTFLKDYKSNNWNQYVLDINNSNNISFPLIRLTVEK